MIWDEPSAWGEEDLDAKPVLSIPGVHWAKVQRHHKSNSTGRYHAWRGTEALCHLGRGHGASRVKRSRIPGRACRECLARLGGASTQQKGGNNGGRLPKFLGVRHA